MASTAYERRDHSHVRIWSSAGPVGGGFVVAERLVMTCAHVVAASLGPGADVDETGRPTGIIYLDSLAAEHIPTRRDPASLAAARVVPGKWIPRDESGGGDIALLELCPGHDLPRTAVAAVRSEGPASGQGFSAFGIIEARDPSGATFHPKIVEGRLQGPLGGGRRYQIGSEIEESAVRRGCSGSAVWMKDQGVVGMVVSWQERLSGVMIPVALLDTVHPIQPERPAADAPDRPAAIAKLATLTRASSEVAEILMEQLPSFDREPQTTRFETAMSRTWDESNRPLLCLVGGLRADLPRACRDTLRSQLGGRFAELQVATSGLKAHKLPWPDTKQFDIADAIEGLKNGIKAALKETRGNDPDRLRSRYNDQLKGFVFFSEIVQEEFGADHQELLRRWRQFWEALGAEPLNKPLAHLLLFTFRDQAGLDVRRANRSRLSFYESRFPPGEAGSFERLPMLTPFQADDVEDWLDSFEDDVELEPAVMRRLRLEAGRRFPAEPSCRLAELEKWIMEIGE
ncbi:MAG TPA: serine protease [Allosphingosinicella sp.]|jgi:hypothetical protein